MSIITDEKDLGKAVKRGEDTIELDIRIGSIVIKIKAVDKIAWMACAGAIGVAVIAVISLSATGGTSAPVSALVGTPALAGATAVLGSATIPAIMIAVAGGGVSTLNKLREYRVEKLSDGRVILHKK